jgi:hypothetical protein
MSADTTKHPNPAVQALDRVSASSERTLGAVESLSRPWWYAAPDVFVRCVEMAFLPIVALTRVAEAAVSVFILGIVVVAGLWWAGVITDAAVVETLTPVGRRIVDMIESSAL